MAAYFDPGRATYIARRYSMSETRIKVEAVGLDEVVKNLSRRYPEWADRARRSALASTGNMIRQELRNHIEYGGTGWPSLHPLSKRRKDKGRDLEGD